MQYGLVNLTPAVKKIIIVTCAVFCLQILLAILGKPYLAEALFALILKPFKLFFTQDSGAKYTLFQVWRPFTYIFLHHDFWHILWNMLGLFFLGSALEEAIGTSRLYSLYISCGVVGGLFAILGAEFGFGGQSLIGASAAVMGVTFAYIALFPQRTIMMWFIVLIPCKALYLGIILLLIQLWNMAGTPSGISYTAHLGGIAMGVFMAKRSFYFDSVITWLSHPELSIWQLLKKKWQRRHLKQINKTTHFSNPIIKENPSEGGPEKLSKIENNSNIHPLPHLRTLTNSKEQSKQSQQVDQILRKISKEGMKSLTEEEKAFLDSVSKSYRQ